MMVRGKIAAVSYLNTVPFIYGIEHASDLRADLLLSPPSGCAERFRSGDVDVALLPVAAIPSLENTQIITSYCLGASGPVRTVTLMSNYPIEQASRVWLDSHSLTSVMLTKVLCAELWRITPEWVDMVDYSVVDNPSPGDAFLLIGDKVFDYEGRFPYVYDLAECWRKLTGLPFVFAAWVARNGVDPQFITSLDKALRFGLNHIREAIALYGHSGKPYAYEYLTRNLDFLFDGQKRQALALFWQKGARYSPG